MTATRTMLSFPFEGKRFNYRVAAVIIVDAHLLVCHLDDDPYSLLPGGRVEFGEPSPQSLSREIVEEIGMSGEIGALLFTSEAFFTRDAQEFHEIGFYYRAMLPAEARPNGQSPWLVREEEPGHILRFHWVPLAGRELETIKLNPSWLPNALRNLPQSAGHILNDERHRG